MENVKKALFLCTVWAIQVLAAPQLPGIATTAANTPGVDIHSHYYSPAYLAALNATGHGQPDRIPFIPKWSVESHLAFMNRNGIQKSILSCSTPGTFLVPGDVAAAVRLTRETNQYAADLKKQYPDRFGFWASLPLPDIKSSLDEIDYAIDHQKADGIMLLSNHQGIYLGDPALKPVMDKLNRRRITVFVHPTVPCNKYNNFDGLSPNDVVLQSAPLMDGYLSPMLEYFFDSTRSFVDLLLSGTAVAYPSITWIVTHCGVALPSVLDRAVRLSNYNLTSFGTFPARQVYPITADKIRTLFAKQFYFDLAGGTCMPNDVPDLLRWVQPDKIVYGSDVPWTDITGNDTLSLISQIQAASLPVSSRENLARVFGGNARKLLSAH